jgi:hypothetical protein
MVEAQPILTTLAVGIGHAGCFRDELQSNEPFSPTRRSTSIRVTPTICSTRLRRNLLHRRRRRLSLSRIKPCILVLLPDNRGPSMAQQRSFRASGPGTIRVPLSCR